MHRNNFCQKNTTKRESLGAAVEHREAEKPG
jgi:hypothetical protein